MQYSIIQNKKKIGKIAKQIYFKQEGFRSQVFYFVVHLEMSQQLWHSFLKTKVYISYVLFDLVKRHNHYTVRGVRFHLDTFPDYSII